MVQVLPTPSLLFTSTSPLNASILDLTTSRPTPRPDTSVTSFAVEKLGRNNKSIISLSDMLAPCSGVMEPLSIAFWRTLSTSIPLPSSLTSITTLFPSWYASRKMEPVAGLPLCARTSADSKPWSAELRIKCINGSPISSTTVRSSSVSSPVIYNSIFLSNFLDKSRTIRGNLLTTLSIGTIRTFITDSCKFVVTLSKYSICSLKFALCEFSCVDIDTKEFFAIISSLTKFIRESNFSISTRTVLFTTGLPATGFFSAAGAAAFAAGAATGFFSSTFAGAEGSATAAAVVVPMLCLCILVKSITSPITLSISETLRPALITSSRVLSVTTIRLKSLSNFSSSISCAGGLETIISPFSSIALNTRNALAALRTQESCTQMVRPNTFFSCFCASSITSSCALSKTISSHFLPALSCAASVFFASFLPADFLGASPSPPLPLKIAFN